MSAGEMPGLELDDEIAERYRRFAQVEAAQRSPAYEQLALYVAADTTVLEFLRQLPRWKQQPNLLFAAASYLLGTPPDPESLRRLVTEQPGDLAAVMRARLTQTNEAARCATLLPALAQLPSPLALLEVGASAGLTLLADRYSYDYAGHRVPGADPQAPALRCQPTGAVPLPARVPDIAWRAGLDLNPLHADDADDVRWLSCMLWPGEAGRTERLAEALATARRYPVLVHEGDLLDDLERLAAQAPGGATLVIYHTAVLAYVDRAKRRAFGDLVRQLGAVWLSNEAPGVLDDGTTGPPERSGFLLIRDGTQILARADPHGLWIEWLA